jgi:hypothetical protein
VFGTAASIHVGAAPSGTLPSTKIPGRVSFQETVAVFVELAGPVTAVFVTSIAAASEAAKNCTLAGWPTCAPGTKLNDTTFSFSINATHNSETVDQSETKERGGEEEDGKKWIEKHKEEEGYAQAGCAP